ncbi:MAG: DUF362 domain-containing protein [Bryobacteraceae bacterium]
MAATAGCGGTAKGPAGNSAVAVLKAESYGGDLRDVIRRGIDVCRIDVHGKRVLLKPNLVEFDSTTSINTHAAVLAAAVDVFRARGADVSVGEGPGHRRDTIYLADEAGYREAIAGWEQLFTDLNRDDVVARPRFGDHKEIYFPKTVLDADLVVSMPKMKAHHWAGATLSMKNLFGLVPGAIYGWPKNFLHYVGIDRSIVEINRHFRNTFAIVDGIVGMEGNGPIQGKPKQCGVLVMGQDVMAVDATCCRIMGIDPAKLEYLTMAPELGHIDPMRIEQRGESPAAVRTDFALTDRFRHLRLS